MADNYFDKFDPSTAKPDGGGGNYFDRFDPATAKPEPKRTWGDSDKPVKTASNQEQAWGEGDSAVPASALRKVGDLGLSVAKGVVAVPEALVGLVDIPTGGRVGKFLENEGGAFGFRPKQAKEYLGGLQSDDLRGKQQQFQKADGIIDKAGVALSNPSLITNAVAESVPLMGAGAVPARAALSVAPKLGAVASGAIGEGVVGAGSAAEGIRQETADGLMTAKQSGLALASGAATSAFGFAGGKMAQRLGIGDVDTMLTQGAIKTAGVPSAKSIPRQVVEGAIAEGWLEELPQSVSEQVLQNLALDKPWHEGVDDAAVMGTLAGMAMGGAAAGVSGFAQDKPSVDAQPSIAPPAAPQPQAGPTLALPAPDQGVIAVGGDGTARTPAYQKPSFAGEHADVTDVVPRVLAPQPADPVRAAVESAANSGGALSGAALVAIDSGVTPRQEGAFEDAPELDAQQQINLDDITDPYDRAYYESLFDDDPAPLGAPPVLSAFLQDDDNIPDFDAANNVSEEDFLRALGADELEIQDAIATTPDRAESAPEGAALPAGPQADVTAGTPEGAGAGAAQPAGPVTDAPTNLREGLERIRAQRQEAANAQAAAQSAPTSALAVSTARPGAVEAAGPAPVSTTTGVTDGPQAAQAQQSVPEPTQTGGAATAGPAAAATAGQPATVGGSGVQAAGMTAKRALYDAYKATGYPDDVVAASVLKVQEKADALGAPVSVWRGAGGTIGVVPASQSSPFKGGELIATVHPNAASAKQPQEKAAPAQNDGAQGQAETGPQGAAQAAQAGVAPRPKNWRTSMLGAVPVAKAMGIDTKGKRLTQVVAEIDARDTRPPAAPIPAPTPTPDPVRIGRDQTPLAEGGKPFKTRKAAADAKKLQPMMRVVPVDGGYVLAEKTPAQLAAEAKAARRLAQPRTGTAGAPLAAHEFIAAEGGLNAIAASDLGIDGNPRIGNRRLFAGRGRGLSMEQATQKLIADGYLGEGATLNDAYAIIKTSLSRPQYNADGYERIAQAESDAQFDDYMTAQEEMAQDDDGFDGPFGLPPELTAEDLAAEGYTAANPALQAEVNALVAQAEAAGIDTYDVLEDIARNYADATQDQYNAAAREALAAAIARSNQDGGRPTAATAPAAPRSEQEQGLNQPVTLELAAQTPAEAAARQDAQEQAAKAEAAAKRAEESAAKAEDERKRIAQASVRAADSFELGQDPMDSLTGQGAMFSRVPAISRADSNAHNVATQLLVDGLKAKWTRAPEIIVARNMQDTQIPQAVRDYDETLKSQGATGEARGFIYKGKVYLLSDELKGPQQIAEVLFHEVLGHYGLRGAFGNGLDSILQQMGAMRRKEVVAKAREYGLFDSDALGIDPKQASNRQIWDAMSAKQRMEAAEEVLAEMAQTQPNIGFVQRAIAAIRNWLRAHVPGFERMRLTDADVVQAYILPARGFVTRSKETGAQSLERAMAAFSRGKTSAVKNKNAPTSDTPDAFAGRPNNGMQERAVRAVSGSPELTQFTEAGSDAHLSTLRAVDVFGDGRRIEYYDDARGAMYSMQKYPRGERWTAWDVFHAQEGGNQVIGEFDKHHSFADAVKSIRGARISASAKARLAKYSAIPNTWDGYAKKLAKALIDAGVPIDRFANSTQSRSKYIYLDDGRKIRLADHDLPSAYDAPDYDYRYGVGNIAQLVEQITTSNNSSFDPANPDIRFSRTSTAGVAARMGDAIKSVTVQNVKDQAGYKKADYLGLGLQTLGRRQIVDVYGDIVPLAEYNTLVTQMEADKNEGGAEADKLVKRWAELPDEGKLADLMHEATLAQIDPAKPYVGGDDKAKYAMLAGRFNALSQEAKQVYTDTRDAYQGHHAKVRSAIKERIERSELKGPRKAELLKQMDDEFFAAVKGVYFPLARFGQYAVTVKGADGKVESVSRAETKAEAEALRNSLLSAFPRDKGFTVGRVMLSKDFIADRDAVGRGFMTELYQVLDKQDMDAAQRAELEDTLGQLYLSSLPDLSWAKHGIHRKGTPGFSQDARRAYAQNMFHGSRYLAKLRYSDLMQDELTAMQKHVDDWREAEDFDQNSAQRVVDEMNKRHESLMNPKSNPLSTALTSFGFIFYLGLSPASAMVNLSQTALVAYPIMGAKWGFGKASAALLKASAEAAKGKNDITGSLNADERAAYDEAVRAGTIDVTMAHDLAGIAQGEDAGVMWKIRPVMRWASFLFHHAERFNRQVTFVASYRLAREAGADQKAAFEQATKATYDGHFDYGAANRPRVMQGNVAKVLLLFKQYGQNMVYTLARNAQQAMKAETPEARAQARKALAGLLTSHAMAAGVLGLPMVTTLLAAASMIGGDDDEPWDAKVALQNMLADTFGQKTAEVLAHGLSRLTPWDISGRVGLDRLIFPDVQEGLEGQRLAESAMAAALGPVAGIGVNVLKGAQLMSEGRYALGLEAMLPSALRGLVKAIRYANDGVQDKSGISILDEVGPAAVAGQALGFSPSQARNAQAGKSAVMAHDRALGERRQELLTRAARASMAKDAEALDDARKEIARFNEKNPGRRINPNHIMQSVRGSQKRIDQAEGGIYLPKNRRDAMEAGRFALGD